MCETLSKSFEISKESSSCQLTGYNQNLSIYLKKSAGMKPDWHSVETIPFKDLVKIGRELIIQ